MIDHKPVWFAISECNQRVIETITIRVWHGNVVLVGINAGGGRLSVAQLGQVFLNNHRQSADLDHWSQRRVIRIVNGKLHWVLTA